MPKLASGEEEQPSASATEEGTPDAEGATGAAHASTCHLILDQAIEHLVRLGEASSRFVTLCEKSGEDL